jgi:hypothetical protein
MKKGFLLKVVVSAGLFICIGMNGFGQAKEAALTVTQAVEQYVTVDKAMPYFVEPDIYFNPGWTAGGGWAVVSNFAWTFSAPAPAFTITDATVINPDITINDEGTFTLNVVETSADGCADATPTQLIIHVLAVPTFDFGSRADVEQCGPITVAQDVLFDIADNGADAAFNASGDYLVDWTYNVDELSADRTTVLVDHAGDLDATNTDDAFATSGTGKVLANQTFPVLGGHITRYTFTLTGINEAVSRQSDWIAPLARGTNTNYTNYPAGADDTFEVIVLPAPTTGPIYHLPNL